MKKSLLFLALSCLLLGGCLTSSVSTSGGFGATTVQNTNPSAIIAAAQNVFSESGYTLSLSEFPQAVSFDRPAGTFSKLLYGSYGVSTTIRVTLNINQIPGTNNYRIGTRVSRVSDAGEPGFEDSQKMFGFWSAEFTPLLRRVAQKAGGAGPY